MTDAGSLSSPMTFGKLYTFYSYKGGVGRSMALVNVGVLLALEGHRVLLVDWDLEAPGLETFFVKSEASSIETSPETTPGVLDLLEAQEGRSPLDWNKCLLKVNFEGGTLDLITAGRKSTDYRQRVQRIDWRKLFEDHNIGNYLDGLREEWRRSYDFVLIDSRTGITDIGDICTVILPDVIVALFVANHQNVDGVKNIVSRARLARRKMPVNRAMLMVVPIPGRDESKTEYDLSMKWRDIFEREFGLLFREWLPMEILVSDALSKLFIPYIPIWSFGERIPVLEGTRELQDPTSIGSAYLRLTTLLSSHLDWYAVFEKADTQELKNAKIELDRKQRENEVLRQRQSEQRRSYLLATGSVLSVLAVLAVAAGGFFAYKQANTIPSVNIESLTLQVCIGSSADGCAKTARWASCGTNVNDWARQNGGTVCQSPQITKLSDFPGGQCGYATFNIRCSNPDAIQAK